MPKDRSIVALDLGTSKISCLIGENIENRLEVIGKGESPSHGVDKGSVVDIEKCSRAIELAILEAENSSGKRVNSLVVGTSGGFITSFADKRKIKINGEENEITSEQLASLLSSLKNEKFKKFDREMSILHVLPRLYLIDGHSGVKNPVGMVGKELEVEAYLIAGFDNYLQNISRMFTKMDLDLDDPGFVSSSLAAADVVVTESEKDLGVIFIDIGAGTTKLAVYKEGNLIYSRTILMGGDLITRDISKCLKIPLIEAENLKISEGSACPDLLDSQEENRELEAASFSESTSIVLVGKRILAEIIEARLIEIFEIIKKDIHYLNSKGVYIVGSILTGGVAKLEHVDCLAQRILEIPAKIGRPKNLIGLGDWEGNPEYSSVVGILSLASSKKNQVPSTPQNGLVNYFKNFIRWLQEVF